MALPMNVVKEVEKRVKQVLKEYWNVDLNIPVVFSKRMTSTHGQVEYRVKRHALTRTLISITPVRMKFAEMIFNGWFSEEDIMGTIKHECCHYALSVLGKPFSDGDFYFKHECRRIGAPLYAGYEHPKLQMVPFSFGSNKPQVQEAPKAPKAVAPKAPTTKVACEVKPAQRIKEAFAQLMPNLTKAQFAQLQDSKFCERTFGMKYAFLKEYTTDADRKVNGHNRYYTGTVSVYGKAMLMCNDLYKSTAEKFEAWAKA